MTSHYDTLGIKPDATPDEIKAAYRKMSSMWHPDKCEHKDDQAIFADRMAEINRANDCLSNPERRARYAETGSDAPEKTIEAEVKEMLLNIFSGAMGGERDDLLTVAREIIAEQERQLMNALINQTGYRNKMARRQNKIKTKEGPNLVEMILAQQIGMADEAIVKIKRGQEVTAKAKEVLNDYQQEASATQAFARQTAFNPLLADMAAAQAKATKSWFA